MSSGPPWTGQAVSVELPAGMARAPELESERLPIVARMEPWESSEQFRPNLNVEVLDASPECSTIQQLSGTVIAGQLALGPHVIACDAWRARDRDGRRLTSIYPGADSTVLQLQYAAFCGNVPLVISLQFDASLLSWGEGAFERAVWSLAWEWDDGPAYEPDPATMPALDEFALTRGEQLERLSHIRGLQPYTTSGEELSRPRQFLPRLQTTIAVEARTDRDPQPRGLRIVETADRATIEGDPPLGSTGTRAVADVVPTATAAIALARWLGVAPAWGFGFAGGLESESIPASLFEVRTTDPDAPAPGTDASLARVWSQPWELTDLAVNGRHRLSVLTTPEAGSFLVKRGGEQITLEVLPSFSYLRALLKLTGFTV